MLDGLRLVDRAELQWLLDDRLLLQAAPNSLHLERRWLYLPRLSFEPDLSGLEDEPTVADRGRK